MKLEDMEFFILNNGSNGVRLGSYINGELVEFEILHSDLFIKILPQEYKVIKFGDNYFIDHSDETLGRSK